MKNINMNIQGERFDPNQKLQGLKKTFFLKLKDNYLHYKSVHMTELNWTGQF